MGSRGWGWGKQNPAPTRLVAMPRHMHKKFQSTCTRNSILGANAILVVSLAICRVGAAVLKVPLYKVQDPHRIKYNGTIQGLKYIWRTNGFHGLFKGNGTNNCPKFCCPVLQL
ncbi:hypothetical protein JHK87_018636 [Glycine soja]|nr:hypothetical protein JHK87_018636 [Glycine soja]